jgi:predicted nucleotidyltransferase component of viral defense system
MNKAVLDMLERYDCRNAGDFENALREIFQELALLGLWRSKFFEHAAFYGGTALRILHGLDRFSEDMDFSLIRPDQNFNFSPYIRFIEKELEAWGFPVQVTLKEKGVNSSIESAFLKAETLKQMILIEAPEAVLGGLHRDQLLRIKVEIDTDPPPDFETESNFLLQPIPFSIRSYTLPSLFSGKMHALLFRKWGRRVKGRDWYDLIWYVTRGIPIDLKHLSARMRQTGQWDQDISLSEVEFKNLFQKRILELDIRAAVADVEPFLKNRDGIEVWSTAFFMDIARRITTL